MIVGSKDPEINKIRFRSSNRLFQNSSCVFIEYLDGIQLPWFTFLNFFRENTNVDAVFNTEVVRHLSVQALLNYYFAREYRNPLVDLIKDKTTIDFEKLDKLLESQINDSELFFNVNLDTNIVPAINNLLANDLIKKLVVYYPTENEFVKRDVESKFNGKAKIITGDIKLALQQVPVDTTYFFSDVMNVLILEEIKKIDFSAIMIPMDYRYNFIDDKKEKYIVDMEHLMSKYTFKWGTYRVA